MTKQASFEQSTQLSVCDLCSCTEYTPLHDKGRGNEDVSVVVCNECGLVFQNPRPSHEQLRKWYEGGGFTDIARGSRYPDKAKISQLENAALRRYRHLSSLLNFIPANDRAVLEIGCSIGSFLRLMRGAGWQVTGVEPDEDYATYGDTYYNLQIEASSYEDVEYAPESFDLVTSFHVLEHVESPSKFIEKIARELRPEGHVVIEVPSIAEPYGDSLDYFFWAPHLTYFSPNTLQRAMVRAGIEPINTFFVGNFLCVIGKKTGAASEQKLPFDSAEEVVSSTKLKGAKLKEKGKGSKLLTRLQKRLGSMQWTNPHSYVAAVETVRAKLERRRIASNCRMDVLPGSLVQFGYHVWGNAGDSLLFPEVRRLYDSELGKQKWTLRHIQSEVSSELVAQINDRAKGVVVGGGGLFLRDTNANQNSGWQWDISLDNLKSLEKPLMIFAVGYNRFRDQGDFDDIFNEHLIETIDRAAFVGLRNSGSIRAIKEYLPDELRGKLNYQPCPTTLSWFLNPKYRAKGEWGDKPTVAFNFAFDRSNLRFKGEEDVILQRAATAMKVLKERGWNLRLAIHSTLDRTVEPWLRREGVDCEYHLLNGIPPHKVLEFYSECDLAIGMRGHAQMVPFGVGCRIFSLVSHDKMQWFLDDINHSDWGVEVSDNQLTYKIVDFADSIIQEPGSSFDEVRSAQDYLMESTRKNFKLISAALS